MVTWLCVAFSASQAVASEGISLFAKNMVIGVEVIFYFLFGTQLRSIGVEGYNLDLQQFISLPIGWGVLAKFGPAAFACPN